MGPRIVQEPLCPSHHHPLPRWRDRVERIGTCEAEAKALQDCRRRDRALGGHVPREAQDKLVEAKAATAVAAARGADTDDAAHDIRTRQGIGRAPRGMVPSDDGASADAASDVAHDIRT